MAERLHTSSNVPDFSTFPEEPATAAPNLEATYATYRRYSETDLSEESALSNAAARLGNTLGNAVSRVRDAVWQARTRMRSSGPEGTGMGDLRSRARHMAQEEPLRVILLAGALGLVVGASIRMWREHD
jgi:hypothetical protein